ncbi:hypothetical protein Ancab_033061 [Ancistrocladus abbreviatus]
MEKQFGSHHLPHRSESNGPLIKELLADLQALNQARYGADFLELVASQIGIDSTGHLGGNFGNSGRPDSMLRVPSFGFGPGVLLREDEEHQCWKSDCRILWWAKDQNGCRFLQMKFEDAKEEEIEMVFFEVIENVDELMTDPFANYLFQKLVEVCSEEQRTKIISSITKTEFQLVNICTGTHGTRFVQKLLTHLTNQEQISLALAALRPGVVALIKDLNGHHVIQHCLNYFSAIENEVIQSSR